MSTIFVRLQTEVRALDVICESCGAANKEGTEFCLFCGAYLAWDRSVLVAKPTPPTPSAPAPPRAAPTPTPAPGPAPTQAPAPAPTPAPAPAPPPVLAAPPVGPPPPMPEPRPTPPVAVAPAAADHSSSGASGGPCPSCGRVNEPSLRFCAKCGQVLSTGAAVQSTTGTPPAARNSSWWSKRDRAARLAYRRSLPPLYRWRRVLIAFLVAALGLGGLVAVGRHPVRWAVDRFYDLRGSTVIIPNVQAAVDPPTAGAPGSDPATLTDRTEAAWTMSWAPTATGGTCGGAPGTGVMVLTLPTPTRVRQIDLDPGLMASNAERPLQFRPQAVGITFDGGPCNSFPLAEPAGTQTLEVDSRVPVTTVRIGVDLAYPARADGKPLLSLTEITLRSRP